MSSVYFQREMNPSLELIIGPMFSGKTTEMIRRLTTYSNARFKVVYINSVTDSRGESFSTHNKSLSDKQEIPMIKATRLSDISAEMLDVDVIGVDEAQFFDDLVEFCRYQVEEKKKTVIVCGLNATSDRTHFGEISKLIPICDDVNFLKSFCNYCSLEKKIIPASFTKRTINEKSTICVGGIESYVPVCRFHFENSQVCTKDESDSMKNHPAPVCRFHFGNSQVCTKDESDSMKNHPAPLFASPPSTIRVLYGAPFFKFNDIVAHTQKHA